MKLKHKLPLITMLVLIITFIFLWTVTQKTASSFVVDYQHKMAIANIERQIHELEQRIIDGEHILKIISKKIDSSNLDWEIISSYLYNELEDSVFDQMGLVYDNKTYNITGVKETGDLSDRKYIKELYEKKTIVISDPVYSKIDEVHQIVIANPIIYNDEVRGALIGVILIDDIAEHIYELNIEGKGHGFLIDRYGNVVLQPREDVKIPCEKFAKEININRSMEESGYILHEDCDNIKRYVFFKNLKETGLIAAISVKQKDLYRPVRDIFKQNVKTFSAVLISIVFFSSLATRRFLKPINDLILGMKKVEDGDYTLQIPVERQDEFGDVAVQFNKTIEAISLRDEELQALNEELYASFEEINSMNDKLLEAYDEIEKRLQNEKIINDLSETFYSIKDSHKLLRSVLVYTEKIINSERCAIYFYNEECDCFSVIESINFNKLDKCISYKKDEGTIGWIVENKEELLITDTLNDLRFTFKHSWSADISMLLQIPIFNENENVIGVISYFGNDLNLNFTPYLKQLSKMVSVTIQNSNLITEIEKAHFSIIRGLVKAIELKDKYIKGHSERVMEYSLMLGKKLNLSDEELKILRYGSILHDIGKLDIPDNVLLKPGKLNEEEYDLIKSHPEKGVKFVEDLEFLRDTLFIIRNHHERIDGKGYPDGLKGDQIERLTKIVTIADAYDAITSKRAYRDALSKEEAIIELKKHKGTQFDSYLLEKFIEIISDSEQNIAN